MSITTSSGERYDELENFIGGTPNEYVQLALDTSNLPTSGRAIPEPLHEMMHSLTDPSNPKSYYYGDTGSKKSTDLGKAAGVEDIQNLGQRMFNRYEKEEGEEAMVSARMNQWLNRTYEPGTKGNVDNPTIDFEHDYAQPPKEKK